MIKDYGGKSTFLPSFDFSCFLYSFLDLLSTLDCENNALIREHEVDRHMLKNLRKNVMGLGCSINLCFSTETIEVLSKKTILVSCGVCSGGRLLRLVSDPVTRDCDTSQCQFPPITAQNVYFTVSTLDMSTNFMAWLVSYYSYHL